MSRASGNRGLWGPVWAGLVDDPGGKHVKRMGQAVWLYLHLVIHANWDTGRLVRTFQTISNDTGIPVRTLKNWMSVLKKYKYVEVIRKPYSFSLQITNWDSIKSKIRSAKSSPSDDERSARNCREKCKKLYREVPDSVSGAKSSTSVNGSKEKGKCERSAKSSTPNEIFNEINNETQGVSVPKIPKSSKAKNPDIKTAVDHYHDEFIRVHGFKPVINGVHGKIYKDLLENQKIPLDQLNSLTTKFLKLGDHEVKEAGYPIQWLPGRINGLILAETKQGAVVL